MSNVRPEKQAATTTSVSNKEYSTYLPLPIIENGPGVFTNPFTDEVEAASMSGFFTNGTNVDGSESNDADSSSFVTFASTRQNQIEVNNNKAALQHQQNLQQQQHDNVPALPLHFQVPDRSSKVTQLNASSFILGEIPTLNSIPMIENDKNQFVGILQSKEHIPILGSDENRNGLVQDPIQTLNQVQDQGKYHMQQHSNVTSEPYSNNITQRNQPLIENEGNTKIPKLAHSSQGTTTTLNRGKNIYAAKVISSQTYTVPQTTLTYQKHSKRKSTAVSVSSSSVPPEMSGDEEEIKRRKKRDRNLREQQRSHRITEQISELKRVLVDTADIKFKKTDKHSILCKAVEHIRDLQVRCVSLDTEHQKLVATISQTSELVHSSNGINGAILKQESNTEQPLDVPSSGRNPSLMDENENHFNSGRSTSQRYIPEASTSAFFNTMALFDYKTIFGQCVVALAVFDLDGAIIDFNNAFSAYFELHNEQKPLVVKNETSLFHLVNDPNEVSQLCGAMGVMIKNKSNEPLFWGSKLNSIVNQNQPVSYILKSTSFSALKHHRQFNIVFVSSINST